MTSPRLVRQQKYGIRTCWTSGYMNLFCMPQCHGLLSHIHGQRQIRHLVMSVLHMQQRYILSFFCLPAKDFWVS